MGARTAIARRNRAEELAVERQVVLEQVVRIDRAEDDARRRAQALIDNAQKRILEAEGELETAERLDALEDEALEKLRRLEREQAGLIAQIPLMAIDVAAEAAS